jgi:hypothetical protein
MAEKIIIKIKAHLDEYWAEWFDKMVITYEGDLTVLSGENIDKAYLHGVLNRIRDMNLKLLSVDTKEDSEEK